MGDPSEGGPKKGNDLSKADLDIIQQSNQRGMYYKRKERLRRDVQRLGPTKEHRCHPRLRDLVCGISNFDIAKVLSGWLKCMKSPVGAEPTFPFTYYDPTMQNPDGERCRSERKATPYELEVEVSRATRAREELEERIVDEIVANLERRQQIIDDAKARAEEIIIKSGGYPSDFKNTKEEEESQ